jgi:hypothetical protein
MFALSLAASATVGLMAVALADPADWLPAGPGLPPLPGAPDPDQPIVVPGQGIDQGIDAGDHQVVPDQDVPIPGVTIPDECTAFDNVTGPTGLPNYCRDDVKADTPEVPEQSLDVPEEVGVCEDEGDDSPLCLLGIGAGSGVPLVGGHLATIPGSPAEEHDLGSLCHLEANGVQVGKCTDAFGVTDPDTEHVQGVTVHNDDLRAKAFVADSSLGIDPAQTTAVQERDIKPFSDPSSPHVTICKDGAALYCHLPNPQADGSLGADVEVGYGDLQVGKPMELPLSLQPIPFKSV